MFIFTAKLHKGKLLLGAAAAAALLLTAGLGVHLAKDVAAMDVWKHTETVQGSGEPAEETVSTRALTNEDRIAYLHACGWEADESSCTIREVIIPSDFDETYQSYADLQARQGFDLEKLKGKRVKQITYSVTDAAGEEGILAELLVYRGSVVAGDIFSMQTDGGFTRGLMDHKEPDTADSTKEETGSTGS